MAKDFEGTVSKEQVSTPQVNIREKLILWCILLIRERESAVKSSI